MNTMNNAMQNTMVNSIVNTIKVGTFVGVTFLSKVKMNLGGRKHLNPLWDAEVFEVVRMGLQYGYSYTNAVNNHANSEDFKSGKLPWGEWVEGLVNKVILHKGAYYIRFYEVHNKSVGKSLGYLVNGREATAEEIEIINQWRVVEKRYTPNTQKEMGLTEEDDVRPLPICVDRLIVVDGGGCTIVNKSIAEVVNKMGVGA